VRAGCSFQVTESCIVTIIFCIAWAQYISFVRFDHFGCRTSPEVVRKMFNVRSWNMTAWALSIFFKSSGIWLSGEKEYSRGSPARVTTGPIDACTHALQNAIDRCVHGLSTRIYATVHYPCSTPNCNDAIDPHAIVYSSAEALHLQTLTNKTKISAVFASSWFTLVQFCYRKM
jgi:hypothetical protein